jgi:hypothetical protein
LGEHPAITAARRTVAIPVPYGITPMSRLREMPDIAQELHVKTHTLTVPDELTRDCRALNPCVVAHQGELRVAIRLSEGGVSQPMAVSPWSKTVLGQITDDWQLADARLAREPDLGGSYLEDVRLVSVGERLVGYATACDHVSPPQFAQLDLDDTGNVTAARIVRTPQTEKNWMGVVDGGRLRFVYSVDPLVLLDLDEATGLYTPPNKLLGLSDGKLRGGSPLLSYEDGWIAVVHGVFQYRGHRVYLHYFARFSGDLSRVVIGPPWYFRALTVEFCAGIAQWGDLFVLSFGFQDREACLAIVEPERLHELLGGGA